METNISFSKQVKEELCLNEYENNNRLIALLSAFLRINGVLYNNGKQYLLLKSENARIAKFIYEKISSFHDSKIHLDFINKNNNKRPLYLIKIDQNVEKILEKFKVSYSDNRIDKTIVNNDETISGYLTGAFLASGSINSPVTSNYHLEISLSNEAYAKWLSKLFAKYKNSNIEPKIIKRREKYILYFKKSDQIADFLIMIGAVSSCMEFETIRVDRDFNNSANRLTNSDTANLKKTIETANRQIEEIKKIDEKIGIENLENQKERVLCKLRMENDSASLIELAKLLSLKLNQDISKSNVNHLFRSLHKKFLQL